MVDIVVAKATEVHAQIYAETSVLREIHEYFTFFAVNYQHHPKFKSGFWDGKIRLFNGGTRLIYAGLLEKIKEFADARGYSYEIDPDLTGTTEFSMHEAAEFANGLNVHSNGKPLKLDDYQIAALCYAIRNRRNFFLLPTGGGKTVVDYLVARYLVSKGLRGIIVCPDKGLVGQLLNDFRDYSSQNGWDVDANLHYVYQGQEKDSSKSLVVTTWQSAWTREDEYFHQWDFVIGEEADTFKAKCLKSIGERLVNAQYRIGLTGSLDGKKVHELMLQGLFGPIKQLITTRELQDRGRLAGLRIKCLCLRHPEPVVREVVKQKNRKVPEGGPKPGVKYGWKWDDEKEIIHLCKKRSRFVANLALSMTNNTMVIFENIEHGKEIFKMVQENSGDRPVYYVDGDTPIPERELVRALMEKCDNGIVVASRVFIRGVNIKNLHNIIRAELNKSKTNNLQGIGRGLRALAGKTFMTLYEIVDDLRHKSWENYSIKHLQERLEIYNQEDFKYSMFNVDLEY